MSASNHSAFLMLAESRFIFQLHPTHIRRLWNPPVFTGKHASRFLFVRVGSTHIVHVRTCVNTYETKSNNNSNKNIFIAFEPLLLLFLVRLTQTSKFHSDYQTF